MQRRLQWWGFLLAFTAMPYLGACGDGASTGNENANGNDAAVTQDASLLDDGSTDVDNDQDGYPADQDCDDNDPGVYPGVRRDCQSGCDVGTEICLANGTWNTCTARTDCDCTNPGDTRIVDCGNCGQASQECGLDLKWSLPGECLNQGECAPGEQGQVTCDICGSGNRICGNDCSWGPADCFGSCTPGEERLTQVGCAQPWESTLETCSSTTCEWETTIACTGDCLTPGRNDPASYAVDICIPGGEFIMGCDDAESYCESDASPKHTVALLPYYIDKYEVTVARYRECVNAGVCAAPTSTYPSLTWNRPNNDNLPVNFVDWQQAVDFCAWDGGRALPTEAQWEKAARGPAPSENLHPWGNTPIDCTYVCHSDCGVSPCPLSVTLYQSDISLYGVLHMAGNAAEWNYDIKSSLYYATSPYFEPTGPSTGDNRSFRGTASTRSSMPLDYSTVADRSGGDPGVGMGLRCAHPANQ